MHGAQESRDVERRHADRLHGVRSERERVRHGHEAAVVRLRAHENGVVSAVPHDERRGRARAGRRDEHRDGRRLGHELERGREDAADRHANGGRPRPDRSAGGLGPHLVNVVARSPGERGRPSRDDPLVRVGRRGRRLPDAEGQAGRAPAGPGAASKRIPRDDPDRVRGRARRTHAELPDAGRDVADGIDRDGDDVRHDRHCRRRGTRRFDEDAVVKDRRARSTGGERDRRTLRGRLVEARRESRVEGALDDVIVDARGGRNGEDVRPRKRVRLAGLDLGGTRQDGRGDRAGRPARTGRPRARQGGKQRRPDDRPRKPQARTHPSLESLSMRIRECHGARSIPRASGSVRVIAVALIAFAGPLRAQAILPPDAAVKAYQAGQAAAEKKDWPLVVRKMNEALATGHTQAKTHFGTTRNFVDLYDPYYWLGVAHMELGEVLEAKRNLLLSRSEGVIDGFPESADVLGRLGQLERREAQQASAPPTPTAGPTLAATAAAAPSAVPTAAALSQSDATPTPSDLPGADFERILTLFSAGDFAGAEAAIESLRRARPFAREADLLATLVLGTRYVLEGRADPSLLARARKALSSWRKRGGGRRSEEALLSPSLLATLNGS